MAVTTRRIGFEICAKRRAILEGTGHMLVVGGPGSGKTTIALLKGRRAVLERLRPEQSVLFLSFSNAAIRRIAESGGRPANSRGRTAGGGEDLSFVCVGYPQVAWVPTVKSANRVGARRARRGGLAGGVWESWSGARNKDGYFPKRAA